MITKTCCSIKVDTRVFKQEAIMKTAYLFTDNYYLRMESVDENIINIVIEAKAGIDIKDVDKHFSNELIAQMLRYQIAVGNKNIKELIIGRALYSTCIDTAAESSYDAEITSSSMYSLDDIAVDWFEINENENP